MQILRCSESKQSLGATVLSKTVTGRTPVKYGPSHVDGEVGFSQTLISNSERAIAQTCAHFAVIFSANCLIHLIAFIICCYPLVTLKSHLGLEKQPHILDLATVLTATNLSFITPS